MLDGVVVGRGHEVEHLVQVDVVRELKARLEGLLLDVQDVSLHPAVPPVGFAGVRVPIHPKLVEAVLVPLGSKAALRVGPEHRRLAVVLPPAFPEGLERLVGVRVAQPGLRSINFSMYSYLNII